MKSLLKKETKDTKKKQGSQAQCCAKTAVAQAGCHD